jgi:hypothetical protein
MKHPLLSASLAHVGDWRLRPGRDSGEHPVTLSPSAPPRSATRIRVHDAASGASGPSTLPPAPFWDETSVAGLEWWLDAHMGLASELLWVGQLLDTLAGPDAHAETVRRLLEGADTVRDALYELYCDAADERMALMLGRGAALQRYVRDSYVWCAPVVGLMATVTSGLRAPPGPDWEMAKAEFRASSAPYPVLPPTLRGTLGDLPIDFTSPTEPLRNLPVDLDHLVSAMDDLQATLTPRFSR